MIDLSEKSQIQAIWFIGTPHDFDIMGAMTRPDDGSAPWRLQYRFRYYKDNKVHDSDDVKNWYEVRHEDHIYLENTADELFLAIAKQVGGQYHKIEVRGDGAKALGLLKKQPWASVKTRKGN